ncbi:MAG TPA: hypothetical protein PLZ51_19955, partial [Aggregatilineales bacterium]|nr:hypothetical protein [Aggregatilineales bacterium]
EAQATFNEALEFANDLLNTAPMQYDALYSQALAYAGLWVLADNDAPPTDALKAYEEAKVACSYEGVLLQHRQLLEKLLACSDKNGAELVALLK